MNCKKYIKERQKKIPKKTSTAEFIKREKKVNFNIDVVRILEKLLN